MSEKEEIIINDDVISTSALCINCGEQGNSKLSVVNIPFYDNVFLSSFDCPHCNYSNRDIKDLKEPKDHGIHYEFKIKDKEGLSRMMVRQGTAMVTIPELEFEVMPNESEAAVITIEIFLSYCIEKLKSVLETVNEKTEIYTKYASVIIKLQKLLDGDQHFTFVIDDPSGNSFIENPGYPRSDPEMWVLKYRRTWEENTRLHLEKEPINVETAITNIEEKITKDDDEFSDFHKIQSACNMCGNLVEVFMYKIDIPYFKEVVLSSFTCDACGNRDRTVMSCASICDLGIRCELVVTNKEDLMRDLVKSDNCTVKLVELGVEVFPDMIAGIYTTVEGFLIAFKESMLKDFGTLFGTSAPENKREKIEDVLRQIDEMIEGRQNFTMILDDPTGNSFIKDIMAPDPDPNLTVVNYKRTKEQNDLFCLATE